MRKIRIEQNDLRIGMRVKVPIAGWWLGKPNKKQIWFKGIIHYIYVRNNKIISVDINIKPSSYIGRMMFDENDLNDIYKCK